VIKETQTSTGNRVGHTGDVRCPHCHLINHRLYVGGRETQCCNNSCGKKFKVPALA
jgi:hypothetical protein